MAILVLIIVCYILVIVLSATPSEITETGADNKINEALVNEIILPFSEAEILSNSVGIQYSVHSSTLPNDTNSEREFLTIAAAVSKQWADLRRTEHALKVFSKTLHSVIKNKADTNISHWSILTKLDEAYSRDSLLSQQYVKLKEEIKRNQKPSEYHFISNGINEEQKKELIEEKYGPQIMLFRFLNSMNASQNYSAVTRGYLELAKDAQRYEKVQRLFNDALKESVGPSIDTEADVQTRVVFSTLKGKLIKDEELKTILQQKKIVLPD